MGMTGHLRQINGTEIAQTNANPDKAYELVLGEAVTAETKKRRIEEGRELVKNMTALSQRFIATGTRDRIREANMRREPISIEDKKTHEAYMKEYSNLANASLKARQPSPNPDIELDLDKSWHGIHFLLTGKTKGGEPPLSLAVLGGKPIGDRKKLMSYGPILLLSAEDVLAVSKALETISTSDLLKNYNAASMRKNKIYGAGDDQEQDIEYFSEYYEKLRSFYALAAQSRTGILFYIR